MKSSFSTKCCLYLIFSSQIITYIHAQGLLSNFQDFAATHTPVDVGNGQNFGFPPDNMFPTDASFPADTSFPSDASFPADNSFPPDATFPADNSFPQENIFPADNIVPTEPSTPSSVFPTEPVNPAVDNNVITGGSGIATFPPIGGNADILSRPTDQVIVADIAPPTTTPELTSIVNTNFLPNIPFGGRFMNLITGISNSFDPAASWLSDTNSNTQAPIETSSTRPAQPILPVVLSPLVPTSGSQISSDGAIRSGKPVTLPPLMTTRTTQPTTTAPTTTTRATTTTTRATTTTNLPTTISRQEPGGIALGAPVRTPFNLRPVGNPGRPFGNSGRSPWRQVTVAPTTTTTELEQIPEQSLGSKSGLGFGRGSETYRLLSEISLNNFGRNRDLMRKLRKMSRTNRRNNRRNNRRG